MGRKGVTPAEVVAACVQLKRQRRAVGLRNLRLELARGSYSTIAKRLRQLALVEVLEVDSASGRGHHCRRLGYKSTTQADTMDACVKGVWSGV